jgi:hypothetical protein
MENTIHKSNTYAVMLGGGIFYRIVKQENSNALIIEIEWANGEPVELLSDFNPRPEDMPRLAQLFALVAEEVNA